MTDLELKQKAMDMLSKGLGLVEAERFIALVLREPFDYTEWHRTQYEGETVSTLFEKTSQGWTRNRG